MVHWNDVNDKKITVLLLVNDLHIYEINQLMEPLLRQLN